VTENATRAIREAILTGKLRPGSRLVEGALADSLRVSRAVVREALVALAKEGLVEVQPRAGARVASFGPDDVVEVFSLRMALEELAGMMAVRQFGDQELAELAEIVGAIAAFPCGAPAEEVSRYTLRFHEFICERVHHRRLLEVWRTLDAQRKVFALAGVRRVPPAEMAERHRLILLALRTRDSDRVRRAIRHHLAEAARESLEAMGASPDYLDKLQYLCEG
jgi:DNA-binding GntR family transcriptional regulator